MPGAGAAETGPALLVTGVNHRTSPLELRDCFALIEADLAAAVERLAAAGLGEAALIATCDRVELVTTAASPGRAAAVLAALLAERAGIAVERVEAALYRHEGSAALRHLFAVTSALDSLVVGEPQVLGQVKAAHRLAASLGLIRGDLETAFSAAYQAARRVRRETRIAERPVSIAAAALELAREIHGDLDRCTALLLGPGEMGELIARQFRLVGVMRLVVCGPPAWAERTAQRFSCNFAAMEELDDALAAADIVVAALGSGRTVLTAPRIAAALRRRPRRPIFVIDAAIPADAEPAVNDLDGIFLYDLGDLERAALAGRAVREAASAEAWRIVEAELAAFVARRAERRAVPAVVALRRHVEALRQDALAEAKGDAEAATRLLMGRLLHAPSEVLRDMAGAAAAEEVAGAEDMLRRLFRLGAVEERDE
jgi:glutamyl-tRNA reductase